MTRKLISMYIDDDVLAQIDAKALAANDGKQRGRTEYITKAIRAALDGRQATSEKRLDAIIAAYEGMNAKGRRYLAKCAELAAEHAEYQG